PPNAPPPPPRPSAPGLFRPHPAPPAPGKQEPEPAHDPAERARRPEPVRWHHPDGTAARAGRRRARHAARWRPRRRTGSAAGAVRAAGAAVAVIRNMTEGPGDRPFDLSARMMCQTGCGTHINMRAQDADGLTNFALRRADARLSHDALQIARRIDSSGL